MVANLANGPGIRNEAGKQATRFKSERLRKSIVNLAIIYFVLVVFEGVFRKWVFPSLANALLFIRDPLLLFIFLKYGLATRHRLLRFEIWLLGSVCFLSFALVQIAAAGVPVLVVLLGFRYYLLFVPLALIIWDTFEPDDVLRWLRLCLWISLPIGLLVTLQYYSPVGSIWNAGLSIDDSIFQVVEGVVRPYGTFSFVAGQANFAAIEICALLAATSFRAQLRLSSLTFYSSAFAVCLTGALSGARTFFVYAIGISACYFAAIITTRSRRFQRKGAVILGSCITAMAVVLVFVVPQALENMSERQAVAVEAEGSTALRALGGAILFLSELERAPPLGHGVGSGTNAGSYLINGERSFTLAEDEFSRIILEMGPFAGSLLLLCRISAFLLLGILSLKANLRRNNPIPLIIYGYTGPTLIVGQITTQNTILGFVWFLIGVQLSSMRTGAPK